MEHEGHVAMVIEPTDEPNISDMTVEALMGALRDRDCQGYVDDHGRLRVVGPRLDDDDPIYAALREYHGLLVEMFTLAVGGRCAAEGCYRLPVGGGTTCADHLPGDAG